MNIKQLYNEAKNELKNAHVDSPEFEALCLIEHFFNTNRQEMILHGTKQVTAEEETNFKTAVSMRLKGEPLQYIIGKWEFWGLNFYVGEGVLIPRSDTEILVETVLEKIKDEDNLKIIDLCSGSGAIAISIAKEKPESSVQAIELSEFAFKYLNKNIKENVVNNVIPVNEDIFKSYNNYENDYFDVIVSNPPYVRTDDIKTLQTEVQKEPFMALDGGKDGYDFYKAIIKNWASKLKPSGLMIFEIGEDQLNTVKEIFTCNKFINIFERKDFSGIYRVIGAYKA